MDSECSQGDSTDSDDLIFVPSLHKRKVNNTCEQTPPKKKIKYNNNNNNEENESDFMDFKQQSLLSLENAIHTENNTLRFIAERYKSHMNYILDVWPVPLSVLWSELVVTKPLSLATTLLTRAVSSLGSRIASYDVFVLIDYRTSAKWASLLSKKNADNNRRLLLQQQQQQQSELVGYPRIFFVVVTHDGVVSSRLVPSSNFIVVAPSTPGELSNNSNNSNNSDNNNDSNNIPIVDTSGSCLQDVKDTIADELDHDAETKPLFWSVKKEALDVDRFSQCSYSSEDSTAATTTTNTKNHWLREFDLPSKPESYHSDSACFSSDTADFKRPFHQLEYRLTQQHSVVEQEKTTPTTAATTKPAVVDPTPKQADNTVLLLRCLKDLAQQVRVKSTASKNFFAILSKATCACHSAKDAPQQQQSSGKTPLTSCCGCHCWASYSRELQNTYNLPFELVRTETQLESMLGLCFPTLLDE